MRWAAVAAMLRALQEGQTPRPLQEKAARKSWPQPEQRGSLHAPPLNDVEEDHDDGDDQEDVNESTHGVGGDKPQKPEHEQNDYDGPEHFSSARAGSGVERDTAAHGRSRW